MGRRSTIDQPPSAATDDGQLFGNDVSRQVDLHVGQQIRIHRVRLNLSQTELGRKIGVTFQQIQKYERGRNRVSASALYAIATCLNLPVSKLFEGLPSPELLSAPPTTSDIDNRIAHVTTQEGRQLISNFVRLPKLSGCVCCRW